MDIILARPRGFCAGVVRAVSVVEAALEAFSHPIYVVHEIVHNQRVVDDLRARGAVFVEDLDAVPDGAVVIFSAHGVPSATVERATARGLEVIDATCPLVTKVHLEVARHARAGREVVLIGHAGHPEVRGTMGRYDRSGGGAIYLVETERDVADLEVRNPDELAWVTQTTLAIDDARRIVAALEDRFPAITGPRKDDICYATQNRQNGVRRMAETVDLLLVVGGRNSSNSHRLREVGEQAGVRAYLIQEAADVDPSWLEGVETVGVTAGASTPEVLVQELIDRLGELGATGLVELDAPPEGVTFRLPERLAGVAIAEQC